LSGGAVSVLSGATAVASTYLQNIAANVAGADEVRVSLVCCGHWGLGSECWCGAQARGSLNWKHGHAY
jgi:hypothetical protein